MDDKLKKTFACAFITMMRNVFVNVGANLDVQMKKCEEKSKPGTVDPQPEVKPTETKDT